MKKLLIGFAIGFLAISVAIASDVNFNNTDSLPLTSITGLAPDTATTAAAQPNVTSVGTLTGLTVTAPIAGSVTGNAGTVTTIAGLAPNTATTQATQPNITSLGTIAALVTTDATVNESIGFDAINTVTYSSGTTTVDWSTGNVATMTFGAGNITTFAFTDPVAVGQTVKLKMIQDGVGGRVVTGWDADIQWVGGGTAPTISTGIAAEDWIMCIYTGTGAGNRYDCAASLDFQ